MWTKLENLHGKYVKINSEKDLHLYDDITFELKSLQSIPEYVECVTSKSDWTGKFTVGKIYKKDNYATTAVITLIGDDNKSYTVTYLGTTLSFKPSTKEAFEAQNKPKFEVGKWYEFDFFGKYYLKCSKLSSDYFYYDEGYSFNYKGFRDYKGQKHSINTKPIREVSIEEIQQYLPLNHPDKIKPMENKVEEWIPQVGDWVIAVTPELSLACKALKNKAYKIKSIRADNAILELEGSNEIRTKHCRKALSHEIPNTTQEVKEMSKEELLEEAKRRYPIGTKFKSAYSGDERKIKNISFIFDGYGKDIYETNTGNYVYYNGKWSEIIELPKSNTFDLSNTKIKVDTPELSRLIQEKAFELGWKWNSGKNIISLDSKYLFFYNKFITFSNLDVTFQQSDFKEIFPSDLGINVVNSETKSKLNPITPEQVFKNYEVVGSFTVSNTVIPKEVIKKKGFDEEEFYSNPFNQVLELPKKSKQNNKKQLILT